MPTVEQDNEVERARQLQRIRERAQAFRETFGSWDKPTKHGALMIEGLLSKFGHALPPNILDDHGQTDLWQTVRRLGHFDVLEYIKTQVEWKEGEHGNTRRTSTV